MTIFDKYTVFIIDDKLDSQWIWPMGVDSTTTPDNILCIVRWVVLLCSTKSRHMQLHVSRPKAEPSNSLLIGFEKTKEIIICEY